jgi:hypothetical protein
MTRLEAYLEEEHEHPRVEFEYPHDPMSCRLRDFFLRRYRGDISESDAEWLGNLLSDFLRDESSLVSKHQRHVAARRMLEVLLVIDCAMSHARNPLKRWQEIALSLALPSVCANGLTYAQLGRKHGLSKANISQNVRRLCRFFKIEPAFNNGCSGLRNLQH